MVMFSNYNKLYNRVNGCKDEYVKMICYGKQRVKINNN